jgi:putative transcriptional regulator
MTDKGGVLQGRLLVAAPSLVDPNFARAVVLLLAHGDQGALGLVLNRPTRTSLAASLPEWDELASQPTVVFAGGPVTEGTICLARLRSDVSVPGSGYLPLRGPLGTVDLDSDPVLVAPGIERLRVFAGYAGWGPGQVEAELAQDAWWVVDVDDTDVFTTDPTELWKRVLRRQGGRLALLAALPPDPSVN